MKILIIGNGFIAAEIILKLESEGHEILIFSKSAKAHTLNQQILGNIFDTERFIKVLDWEPQVIVHTAWVTTHRLYTHHASNYNYAQFTSQFARRIIQSDVEHFIVLGSCAEYGPQTGISIAGETELNPINPYAQQKVAAFNSVKKTLEDSKIRLSWLRIFQPYGPRQDKERLIPYMIAAIHNGQQIKLSDISSVHDWVTTRDIASAVSYIIRNSLPIELDAGTAVGLTNIEVLRSLENIIGSTNQWERISKQSLSGNSVAVVGKESPLFKFGWSPKDSLEGGLRWVLDS